jgi:hypothetical protein
VSVRYETLFHHYAHLEDLAANLEAKGKDVDARAALAYHQRGAALTDDEAALLKNVA